MMSGQSAAILKAAVIGHPVSHSVSPVIHNYWVKKYGLSGGYEKKDIPAEHLRDAIRVFREGGYNGLNITVPHKEKIISLCDDLDNTAQKIGAVNTVKIKDGIITGYNTDADGFIDAVQEEQPDYDFTKAPAMILGAGGAAHAVLYGLLKAGAPQVMITNRTKERAQQLAEKSAAEIVGWDEKEKAASQVSLVINTTTLGMTGQPPLMFAVKNLPKTAVVCDIVYTPHETELLIKARQAGYKTVHGVGMLLHQARRAFEIWTGVSPEITEELKSIIRDKI